MGLFPLIHGGGNCEQWEFFIQGIRCGTDPNHPAYWGILVTTISGVLK